MIIPLLQDAIPAGDALGDLAGLTGGALLIGICIRLAVGAYKDAAAVAREREKVCTDTLAASNLTIAALTAEVKAGNDGERESREWVKTSLAELLDHARRKD